MNSWLYVASCAEDGGIYQLRFDGTQLGVHDFTPCPMPMYLFSSGDRLRAVLRHPFHEGQESGVVTYHVANDGSLSQISAVQSTKGICGCHLCELSGVWYVANYLSGSVASSSGMIDVHHGKGVDPVRQDGPHCHMVNLAPDGRFLLCTDLGLDTITTYTPSLNVVSVCHGEPGAGPRHLCVIDDHTVACVNELSCTLTLFSYLDGLLSPRSSLPLPFEKGSRAAAIKKDRNNLYVSVRGANTISMFRIHGDELEPLQEISCGGDSPRDILVADGYLFSMNERSSTVTYFPLDAEGRLKEMRGTVSIPKALCGVARASYAY